MPGSLIALVAKSDEDKHLTGNPQITFWKSAHKRHSNFALQRYLVSRPTSDMGVRSTTVEFKLESIGDLLRGVTLEMELPDLSGIDGVYTDMVGCAAIEKVDFIINGQVIQSLWGDWIAGYELLVENFGKQYALDQLRGADVVCNYNDISDITEYEGSSVAQVVRIPLPYWFTRTSGCALPLVALRHTDVRIRVYLRQFDQLIFREEDPSSRFDKFYHNVQLYADVVHLDREERTGFVSSPLQYLIEVVQRNSKVLTAAKNQLASTTYCPLGTINPPSVAEPIPLQLSLPVKELIWFLEPEPKSSSCALMRYNRWLQFPINEYDTSCNPYEDLIQSVTLRAGGQSIFENEKADWFRLEQPIRYHTNVPAARLKGIYAHSFAIRPEEYQPSGTINFSAIDKAELILYLTKPSQNYNAVVYAWGYNILNIQNGLGGLAYSY